MKKNANRGAAMADYGILVGLIALGAIGAVVSTGDEVADVFCEASDQMTKVPGLEQRERCITDPNYGIVLAPDERFVKAPVQMQADFSDVMFGKTDTGERLIFSEFTEAPAESFWFDTALTSRNPHDASREISSCYILGGGSDPICAEAGSVSAISIPTTAIAMGYAVSPSENLELPWQNDVTISIPPTGEIQAQSWNIEVAREEADPIMEDVAVAFASHTFGQSESGWTYGPFATIEGKFNQPLTLSMINQSTSENPAPNHLRKACYVPSEGADPLCTTERDESSDISFQVAPGAVSVGYAIQLPAPKVGNDWVSQEAIALKYGTTTFGEETITLTRPNEVPQAGALAGAFSNPYSFAEADTGLTEGEFITLEGERNMSMTLNVIHDSDQDWSVRPCYKLVVDGAAICSENTGTWQVPVDAVQIGYIMDLPATKVGADETSKNLIQFYGHETQLVNANFDMIRPNEAPSGGSVAGTFSAPYEFAQDDTGLTDGEFLTLEGTRNKVMNLSIWHDDDEDWTPRPCYKLVVDGEATCGTGTSLPVPVDAVQIGYRVTLPATKMGPTSKSENVIQFSGMAGTLINGVFKFERPNEPFQTGTLSEPFQNPYTFEQSDEGLTTAEWRVLEGDTNHTLIFNTSKQSGTNMDIYGCYKLTVGGEEHCQKGYHIMPAGVKEIGYKVMLPGTGAGNTTSNISSIQFYGGGTTIVNEHFTLNRPNAAYDAGSMSAPFSNPAEVPADSKGWTDVEWRTIGGHNHTMYFRMSRISGSNWSREICYRTSGGTEKCDDDYLAIPQDAVEVGYRLQYGTPAVGGSDTTTTVNLQLYGSGAGNTLFNENVAVTRPGLAANPGTTEANFSATRDFAAADAGWFEAEYIGLSSDRNVEVVMRLNAEVRPTEYLRRACYKMADGAKSCSGDKSNIGGGDVAWIGAPVGAVSVGYDVQIPDAGTDFTSQERVRVYHEDSNTYLQDVYANLSRPAS